MPIKFRFYWENKMWGPWTLNEIVSFDPYQNEARVVFQGYKMQFTGLQDKKGNDVYKEDIVTSSKFDKALVLLAEGEFRVVKLPERGTKPYSPLYNSIYIHNAEIIGNKFENPELLEREE